MKLAASIAAVAWLFSLPGVDVAAEELLFQQEIRPAPVLMPVRVNLDGQSLLFALDTGLSSEVVEPALVPRDARHQAPVKIDTFGSELVTEQVHMPALWVGHWRLPPSGAIVADCTGFRNLTGIAFRGFLGMAPLRGAAIDINFDKRRLRFVKDILPPKGARLYTSGDKANGQMYLPLTFAVDECPPILKVNVDSVPVNLVIDTGSNLAVGLRHEAFETLVQSGTIEKDTEPNTTEVGAGSAHFASGRFTRGDLLGIELKGYEVYDTVTVDNLGMCFLINLNCIIDSQRKRFYFSRRKDGPPISVYRLLGVRFRYEEGRCYVAEVDAQSQAATEPAIRPGDLISKLGPLEEGGFDMASIYELCKSHAGRTIDVELVRPGDHSNVKKRIVLRAN